ncbi:unnamed protein product [Haemonchus placei]|uniref:Uncharacterized protein n=1 Tax=Haemonchus placei TaxID=6290 RepID=A0A0N4X0J1_HAEPC|nr:unnamed protein product [Haemonchus placei]
MLRLVVFVGVFAFSLAAAPRRLTRGIAGGEHQDGEAQVTIVTYFNYAPSINSFLLEVVKSNVAQLEESHHVFYDARLIDVKPKNVDGLFGTVYTIHGVNCAKLDNFISAIKGLSSLTKQVTVTCGGKTKSLP